MNRLRYSALIACTLLLFTHAASAEEPAGSSGATATEPGLTAEEQAWQARIERAAGYRTHMLQTRKGVELFYELRRQNREEIAENRERCAEELRRANRDAKFTALTHCYRRELLLQRELLEKQRQYAESVPGVPADMRGSTVEAIDGLLDAIDAVVAGIESGVYRDAGEMGEAKQNLHRLYRLPAMLSFARLEIDRTQTWIAHLLHRLFTMTQNTELSPEAFAKASETLACFVEAEGALTAARTLESYEETNSKFSQVLTDLQHCASLLRASHTLQDTFEKSLSEAK